MAILCVIACAVASFLALVETFIQKIFRTPKNHVESLCVLVAAARESEFAWWKGGRGEGGNTGDHYKAISGV